MARSQYIYTVGDPPHHFFTVRAEALGWIRRNHTRPEEIRDGYLRREIDGESFGGAQGYAYSADKIRALMEDL